MPPKPGNVVVGVLQLAKESLLRVLDKEAAMTTPPADGLKAALRILACSSKSCVPRQAADALPRST
jgi:hypothetical protein